LHYNSSDYYIAVLGYPKSGKSIFITSLINHLLHENGSDNETIKINDETNKRLKENIKCLNSRTPLDETDTDSIFPYSVHISRGKFLFKKNFKMQIGDFSGDNNAQFHNGYRQWFHKGRSFIWTLQADAFIFVVDLAEVLAQYEDDFYCEKVSNAIYKAWKRIEKSHLGGKNNLKNKPIVLLFTKSDLLLTFYELLAPAPLDQMRIKMFQLGFSKKSLPQTIRAKKDLDPDLYAIIEEKFGDIIYYLKRKSKRYNTIFFSHFLTLNDVPIGIEKVIDSILPK